jgi:hypothetical protein
VPWDKDSSATLRAQAPARDPVGYFIIGLRRNQRIGSVGIIPHGFVNLGEVGYATHLLSPVTGCCRTALDFF